MQLRARPSAPLSCPFSDLSWAAIDLTITGLLLFAVYHPFFERWPKVRQLSISVISGAFGGKGNCLAKGVLDVTFVSGEWSAFGRWQMWAFLFATILTCGAQLYYLNKALESLDAKYVIPNLNSVLLLMGTIGGAIYFEEYRRFETYTTILLPMGVVFTLAGILIPAACKPDDPEPEELGGQQSGLEQKLLPGDEPGLSPMVSGPRKVRGSFSTSHKILGEDHRANKARRGSISDNAPPAAAGKALLRQNMAAVGCAVGLCLTGSLQIGYALGYGPASAEQLYGKAAAAAAPLVWLDGLAAHSFSQLALAHRSHLAGAGRPAPLHVGVGLPRDGGGRDGGRCDRAALGQDRRALGLVHPSDVRLGGLRAGPGAGFGLRADADLRPGDGRAWGRRALGGGHAPQILAKRFLQSFLPDWAPKVLFFARVPRCSHATHRGALPQLRRWPSRCTWPRSPRPGCAARWSGCTSSGSGRASLSPT